MIISLGILKHVCRYDATRVNVLKNGSYKNKNIVKISRQITYAMTIYSSIIKSKNKMKRVLILPGAIYFATLFRYRGVIIVNGSGDCFQNK